MARKNIEKERIEEIGKKEVKEIFEYFVENFLKKNLKYLERTSENDFLYFSFPDKELVNFINENYKQLDPKEKFEVYNTILRLPFFLFRGTEYIMKDEGKNEIGNKIFDPINENNFEDRKYYERKVNLSSSALNDYLKEELGISNIGKNILIVPESEKKFIESLKKDGGKEYVAKLKKEKAIYEIEKNFEIESEFSVIKFLKEKLSEEVKGINFWLFQKTKYLISEDLYADNPYIEAFGFDIITATKKILEEVSRENSVEDFIKFEAEKLRRTIEASTKDQEEIEKKLITKMEEQFFLKFSENFENKFKILPTSKVHEKFIKSVFNEEQLERFKNFEKLKIEFKEKNRIVKKQKMSERPISI